jgi:hypothetical protein
MAGTSTLAASLDLCAAIVVRALERAEKVDPERRVAPPRDDSPRSRRRKKAA